MNQKTLPIIVCLFASILFMGCGGESIPKLATLKGKVTLDGEPLKDIKVSFMPDPERGCSGRTSTGVTDENGEYTLTYQFPDEPSEGVAIGWHKITMRDLLPSNQRDEEGEQLPRRISGVYSASPTTPEEFEVKEGENVKNIEALPNE